MTPKLQRKAEKQLAKQEKKVAKEQTKLEKEQAKLDVRRHSRLLKLSTS